MNIFSILKKKPVEHGKEEFKAFLNEGYGSGWIGTGNLAMALSGFLDNYKGHIFNCVSLIGESLENMEWNLLKGDEIVETQPYFKMLEEPNMKMDWQDLAFCTVGSMELAGNGFWWPIKDLQKIFIIPAQLIDYNYDRQGRIIGYKVTNKGQMLYFTLDEIIHFKYPNPKDPQGFGKGSMQASESQFSKYEDVTEYENALLENMGLLSVVIGGGNERTNKALVDFWSESFTGKKNIGKVGGIPEGFTLLDPKAMTPQQMNFIEIKDSVVDELYKLFKVPQLLVGATEKVNRSNMYESKLAFMSFKIFPIARRMQRTINRFFIDDKSVKFKFIYDLPKDPELESEKEKNDLGTGVRSRAEIRVEERGIPAYPGSERILLSGMLMPTGESTEAPKGIVGSEPADQDKPKAKIEVPTLRAYDPLEYGRRSWLAFVYWQERFEKMMKGDPETQTVGGLEKTWKWLGKKTANNLREFEPVKAMDPELIGQMIIIDPDLILEAFKKNNNGYIIEVIHRAIEQKTMELGITVSEDFVTNYIVKYIETLDDTWRGIVGTDVKQLQKIILDGVDEGESMAKIARIIEAKYDHTSVDFMNRWRANTIARTETATAANTTSHDYLEMGGIQRTIWSTALDEKVRGARPEEFNHRMAESQEVAINEAYIVSNESLLFPGDSSMGASAGNTINCRCIEAPAQSYQMII